MKEHGANINGDLRSVWLNVSGGPNCSVRRSPLLAWQFETLQL